MVDGRSDPIGNYNNDYLAERVRPPWRWAGLYKPDHLYIGACHASRIVDGGVDSQA